MMYFAPGGQHPPHPCTWGSTPTPTPAPGGQHPPPPLHLGVNTHPTPAPGGQHPPPPLHLGVNTHPTPAPGGQHPPPPLSRQRRRKRKREEKTYVAVTTESREANSSNRDPLYNAVLYTFSQLRVRTNMLVFNRHQLLPTYVDKQCGATDTSINPIQLC